MTRLRASPGLREIRLRRSKAQVASILQALDAPAPPLSEAEELEIRARLSQEPTCCQLALSLPKSGTGST